MHVFRALVVDDSEDIRRQALHARREGLDVRVAGSLEVAEAEILENFFHVAMVDLQLKEKAARDIGGQIVLRHLRDLRPSCRRILMTRHPDKYTQEQHEYRKALFGLLDPRDPLISGAIDKTSAKVSFVRALRAHADDWLSNQVEVIGLDEVWEAVAAEEIEGDLPIGDQKARPCPAELDFVVSSVFGQRRSPDDGPPEEDHVARSGGLSCGRS